MSRRVWHAMRPLTSLATRTKGANAPFGNSLPSLVDCRAAPSKSRCLRRAAGHECRSPHQPAQLLLGLKRTQADCIAVALRDVFGNVVAQGIVADPELLGCRLYASAGTHKKINAAPLGMQANAALDLLVRSRPPASRHASSPAKKSSSRLPEGRSCRPDAPPAE